MAEGPRDDEKWFWSLIKRSQRAWSPKSASGNQRRQQKALEGILSELPLSDVVVFNRIFRKRVRDAFRWDVWGAAYVLAGGCSDDAFLEFRAWLVSMGKSSFERVLKRPGDLWKVAESPAVESAFNPRILLAAPREYRRRTGKEIPISLSLVVDVVEPRGKKWASDDELRRRYRRLWDLYG